MGVFDCFGGTPEKEKIQSILNISPAKLVRALSLDACFHRYNETMDDKCGLVCLERRIRRTHRLFFDFRRKDTEASVASGTIRP